MENKLKQICLTTTHDKICYPYNLQSVDDLIVHRVKSSCEIISASCLNNYNIQPNLQITSIKTPKPLAIPQLEFNASKIFTDCNVDEKNFLMLNSNFMPNFTVKNTHNLKCLMGPTSDRSRHVIACLLSTGAIELFSLNTDNDELKPYEKNLSEIRKENLKKLPKEISKFELYKTHLQDISFSNFEWCPIAYEAFKILIVVTKSDKIIFYRIQNESVTQGKAIEIEACSKNRVKWMDLNDGHYLLISTSKGNIVRYSINLKDDGIVDGIKKVDEIFGKVKLPISNIAVDYYDNLTVVLCSKIHSLEVFQFSERESKLVFSTYIDLAITGVEVYNNNLQYFISTLNAKVFFLKLNHSQTTSEIELESCTQLEVVTASVEDSHSSMKYAYYGIATSRNGVLVYVSCFPQTAFDHLANKQPARISINLFTKYDPFEILMDNQSLKLTDYSDCVEAIQFVGTLNIDSLSVLEQMNYNIQLNDEFMYYLKIQLMVVNAKLTFYKTRSTSIFETITETRQSILEIIAVIHCFKVLNYLMKLDNLTIMQRAVIRASSNKIRAYCKTVIDREPFKTAMEMFKPQLMKTLKTCDAKMQKKMPPHEACDYCEEALSWNSLICKSNHPMKRCAVTNLLVSLDCKNLCRQCKVGVIQLETLSNVLGNSAEDNHFHLCPFCDVKLAFYE